MSVKRRPVTIQMHPRNDADILEDIRRLPKGERNTAIKSVLRAGFMFTPSNNHHETGNTSNDALLTEMAQLRSDIEELRQQNLWMQQALEQLPEYLERLMTRLMSSRPELEDTRPMSPPEIDGAPRLSEQQIDARAKRLRKAQW